MVDAMQKWPSSQEPNETGFNIAHHTDQPMLNLLANDPARAQRFAEAMSLFNASDGMEPEHLRDNYDWAALGEGATLVDIGGSHGDVAVSLARRFPNLRCVVQDLPEVVASATVPEGLEDRLSFQAHDFFTEQPVKDADVYLFKWIFHDWSDKYCIRILRALIPALKRGARIVVSEFIMPDPGVIPLYLEKRVR